MCRWHDGVVPHPGNGCVFSLLCGSGLLGRVQRDALKAALVPDKLHVIASAMAQPPGITSIFGKKSGVYGLLTIEPEALTAELHHRDCRVDPLRIAREGIACRNRAVEDLD